MDFTQLPDFINGAIFEFAGGVLLWHNVRRLYQDKQIRGVIWQLAIFWSTWGWWNVFYYAHLDQWWSWLGGLNIAAANSVWLIMAWKYRHN